MTNYNGIATPGYRFPSARVVTGNNYVRDMPGHVSDAEARLYGRQDGLSLNATNDARVRSPARR